MVNYYKRLMSYGGYFDPLEKQKQIQELESKMEEPSFWQDRKKSAEIIDKCNELKKELQDVSDLKKEINEKIEICNLLILEPSEEWLQELNDNYYVLKKSVDEASIKVLLNGKHDKCDALVEIHSGAGGTEACDWASMLDRMYQRWCDKKNYKIEEIDELEGEEAGIKSKTFLVHGSYAFGYLKSEKGVHRLVRISPFDSGKRRHTSFASVNVTPYFKEEEIDIVINPSDVRIDVYRSSGKGGQGVNTTDSAVRITHLPTSIVVTCQNERSQIQNKETAFNILKNKLYQIELEKKKEELEKLKGVNSDINFGSQIRSYVMHPYSLVKDHRTNVETHDVLKVLDGDIDLFINSYLKKGE